MKKMLFLSSHFPSKNAKYAGHKTAFMFLEEYSKEFEIDLIVICNEDEIEMSSLKTLGNVNVLEIISLTKFKKFKNILSSITIFPLKVNSRFDNSILRFMKENILKYDTLYFEFTHSATYLQKLKHFITNQNIIISSHDILFQNSYRTFNKSINLIALIDAKNTYLYEKEIYTLASKVIVQSTKDKELVELLYDLKNKVEVKSPALSDFIYKVKQTRNDDLIEKKSILFWGAMNREENEIAVIKFLDLCYDALIQNDYKLYIVGNKPSAKVLNLQSRNIIVTGFVEDPSEYFIKAEWGIVPLISGAGIKVKTLEMLECGINVLSTYVGAEGISHNNLIIKEIEEFKNVIFKNE